MQQKEPKSLIGQIAVFVILFALCVYLIKLAVGWLAEIWPVLLIIAVVAIAAVIGWRVLRHKKRW